GLDEAESAKRLAEPARHLGVELATLPEQRPQRGKRERHAAAEAPENEDRDRREPPVQEEEDDQRRRSREQAADQLHQSRADEVTDALGIGHDARDEDAALGGIEVADRQTQDVRLD